MATLREGSRYWCSVVVYFDAFFGILEDFFEFVQFFEVGHVYGVCSLDLEDLASAGGAGVAGVRGAARDLAGARRAHVGESGDGRPAFLLDVFVDPLDGVGLPVSPPPLHAPSHFAAHMHGLVLSSIGLILLSGQKKLEIIILWFDFLVRLHRQTEIGERACFMMLAKV
jgi:hypothetical protein